MNNNIKLLNKTFENNKIRIVWDKDKEKYYISIIDIVEVLTESKDVQSY